MREGWGEVNDLLELRQGLGLENVSCLVSNERKSETAYSQSLPGAGFAVMANQQFCVLSFFHSYLFLVLIPLWYKIPHGNMTVIRLSSRTFDDGKCFASVVSCPSCAWFLRPRNGISIFI